MLTARAKTIFNPICNLSAGVALSAVLVGLKALQALGLRLAIAADGSLRGRRRYITRSDSKNHWQLPREKPGAIHGL